MNNRRIYMDKLGEAAPKIIAEASKSPLGVVSLGVMALSVLGYFFFVDASEIARISTFVLMFVGFGLLSITLLRSSSSSKASAAEEAGLPQSEAGNVEPISSIEVRMQDAGTHKSSYHCVRFTHAINRLLLLWFIASFVLFVVMLLQTIGGKYGKQSEAAWAWLLPTFLPTLSVLVASQVAIARTVRIFSVSVFAYRLSIILSILYLVSAFGVVFLEPFVVLPALSLQSTSNLWLAPLQGLVLAAMTLLFASRGSD